MFQNSLQFVNQHREKMLKSLNNNTNPFSMENLLSSGKMSPENLEINITEKSQDEIERSSEDNYKISTEIKSSLSPNENTRSEGEMERLSPIEKNDVFLRFNNCIRSRLCSNCGRLDCNFFQCRLNSDSIIKDNKPVLKFSVSAILGDEKVPQRTNSSGKSIISR